MVSKRFSGSTENNSALPPSLGERGWPEIRKAVFPAAGLGTRFLPMTKSIPKEMLCLVDKPLIQYGVEEAINAGLTDMVIITGRGKSAIEDHFDFSLDFEELLKVKRLRKALRETRLLSDHAHFCYTRQREALGLGHALLCAKNLVNNESFAVILGDEVIVSETPALSQLMKVYQRFGASVLGLQRVARSEVSRYGIVAGEELSLVGLALSVFKVTDLVEKPGIEEAPSDLAIVGRYILTSAIFDLLAATPPGRNGEIQLTDAIKLLLNKEPVYAVEVQGERHDAGTVLGLLKANIAFAFKQPELKRELEKFLASFPSGFCP